MHLIHILFTGLANAILVRKFSRETGVKQCLKIMLRPSIYERLTTRRLRYASSFFTTYPLLSPNKDVIPQLHFIGSFKLKLKSQKFNVRCGRRCSLVVLEHRPQAPQVLQGKVLITEWVLNHKDTADHLW